MSAMSASMTAEQRAQSALVRVLDPPPASFSFVPSVVKVELIHPTTGQTQIRRLPVGPSVDLALLMSNLMSTCQLTAPFLLSFLPPGLQAVPFLLRADHHLLKAFYLHHLAQEGAQKPSVMKLHVVHRKERSSPSSRRSSHSPPLPIEETKEQLNDSFFAPSPRTTPAVEEAKSMAEPASDVVASPSPSLSSPSSALPPSSTSFQVVDNDVSDPLIRSLVFSPPIIPVEPPATEASVRHLTRLVETLSLQITSLESRLIENEQRREERREQRRLERLLPLAPIFPPHDDTRAASPAPTVRADDEAEEDTADPLTPLPTPPQHSEGEVPAVSITPIPSTPHPSTPSVTSSPSSSTSSLSPFLCLTDGTAAARGGCCSPAGVATVGVCSAALSLVVVLLRVPAGVGVASVVGSIVGEWGTGWGVRRDAEEVGGDGVRSEGVERAGAGRARGRGRGPECGHPGPGRVLRRGEEMRRAGERMLPVMYRACVE